MTLSLKEFQEKYPFTKKMSAQDMKDMAVFIMTTLVKISLQNDGKMLEEFMKNIPTAD